MEYISKEEVLKVLKKYETVKEKGNCACGAYIEGGRTDILWDINKLKTINI
jgi:hypothetical protein